MTMMRIAGFVAVLWAGATADAQIHITEWMYNGATPTTNIGEFVELTNMGLNSVDMTGWSFDDNSRTPGSQLLGSFGIVAGHESVILTDMTDTQFRSAWGLAASVKVIGNNSNNLGRSDEINIYDAANALVDRLTYGDQTSRARFVPMPSAAIPARSRPSVLMTRRSGSSRPMAIRTVLTLPPRPTWATQEFSTSCRSRHR